DRRRRRAVVALAGDRRLLVIAEELPVPEDDAGGLDVRVAEVHVAADDRRALERPAGVEARDPAVAQALPVQILDHQPLRARGRRPLAGSGAAPTGREHEDEQDDTGAQRAPHGRSTTFVASRESNRRYASGASARRQRSVI